MHLSLRGLLSIPVHPNRNSQGIDKPWGYFITVFKDVWSNDRSVRGVAAIGSSLHRGSIRLIGHTMRVKPIVSWLLLAYYSHQATSLS